MVQISVGEDKNKDGVRYLHVPKMVVHLWQKICRNKNQAQSKKVDAEDDDTNVEKKSEKAGESSPKKMQIKK